MNEVTIRRFTQSDKEAIVALWSDRNERERALVLAKYEDEVPPDFLRSVLTIDDVDGIESLKPFALTGDEEIIKELANHFPCYGCYPCHATRVGDFWIIEDYKDTAFVFAMRKILDAAKKLADKPTPVVFNSYTIEMEVPAIDAWLPVPVAPDAPPGTVDKETALAGLAHWRNNFPVSSFRLIEWEGRIIK